MKKSEAKKAVKLAGVVSEELSRVFGRYIDALDEDAPDDVSRPQVVGLLVGARHFIGTFKGLEGVLVGMLDQCGLSRTSYERMCSRADLEGKAIAEWVAASVEDAPKGFTCVRFRVPPVEAAPSRLQGLGPCWVVGAVAGKASMIAYVRTTEQVLECWPNAERIEYGEWVETIPYTELRPKPVWYGGPDS